MKKQSIVLLLLLLLIILGFGKKSEFRRKPGGSITKLHYLDTDAVDTTYSTYRNGHFKLNKYYVENFRFSKPSDTTEIFYDKAFLKIAERITFTLKDSAEHYERFDKEENLTADLLCKNGHDVKEKTWDKNKIMNWAASYDEGGYRVSDTFFFDNKVPRDVNLFINDLAYKEILFYRNGKVKSEIYRSVSDMNVFAIKYDSLTQTPSMYYRQDIVKEDKNNPGTFIGSPRLFPVDSVKIKGKVTKLPIGWISN